MNKLPVPENIPLRWELFRGFGKQEIARTCVVTVAVALVCVVACLLTGSENTQIISVVAVMLTLTGCIGVFGRIDQGQSIYEQIQKMHRFGTDQQLFRYVQKDEVKGIAISDISEETQ